MPLLPRLSSLWRNLFRKVRKDRELTEEIEAYLELLVEQKIIEGLDPEEARRAALIELGGKEQIKEQVREARGTSVGNVVAGYALRSAVARSQSGFYRRGRAHIGVGHRREHGDIQRCECGVAEAPGLHGA
jgi:hypothetical protein